MPRKEAFFMKNCKSKLLSLLIIVAVNMIWFFPVHCWASDSKPPTSYQQQHSMPSIDPNTMMEFIIKIFGAILGTPITVLIEETIRHHYKSFKSKDGKLHKNEITKIKIHITKTPNKKRKSKKVRKK